MGIFKIKKNDYLIQKNRDFNFRRHVIRASWNGDASPAVNESANFDSHGPGIAKEDRGPYGNAVKRMNGRAM
jgi:hypothetical protein